MPFITFHLQAKYLSNSLFGRRFCRIPRPPFALPRPLSTPLAGLSYLKSVHFLFFLFERCEKDAQLDEYLTPKSAQGNLWKLFKEEGGDKEQILIITGFIGIVLFANKDRGAQ